MIIPDRVKIEAADKLLERGLITAAERAKQEHADGEILNDWQAVFEFCENGDCVIHDRGSYPLVLKNFLAEI